MSHLFLRRRPSRGTPMSINTAFSQPCRHYLSRRNWMYASLSLLSILAVKCAMSRLQFPRRTQNYCHSRSRIPWTMPSPIGSSSNHPMKMHKTTQAPFKVPLKWMKKTVAIKTLKILEKIQMKISKTKNLCRKRGIRKLVAKEKTADLPKEEEWAVPTKIATERKKLSAIAKRPNVLSFTVIASDLTRHVMGVIVLDATILTFTTKKETMLSWRSWIEILIPLVKR